MTYVSSFVSFSFVSKDISKHSDSFSIDSFPIEMYGSMGLSSPIVSNFIFLF